MVLPEISSYAFGKIMIGTQAFTSDLILFPNGKIKADWVRKQGHLLSFDDLDSLVLEKPDLVLVGTGAHGRMAIDPLLTEKLTSMGIEITAFPTDKAMHYFNQYRMQTRLIYACFHLTC
ncbi:MAG: hypothetical protein KKF12_06370 [Proteobacteria bacterium]|nr:hypothetical protein [Desulfobacula sp.]MBU3953617.1 hypothetical protein [Pseudomonadota bacterium]MBU4130424.1 hypothetical protein [Pseudomonadota bacterium]